VIMPCVRGSTKR